MTTQFYDDRTYRGVFGLHAPADQVWANRLLGALARIDPFLLAGTSKHPLMYLIAAGQEGIDPLLQLVETTMGRPRFEALDALAQIFVAMAPPPAALARLRAVLAREPSPEVQADLLKTLALARDPALVREQLERLADPDPGIVASAARMLGYARFAPAAQVLARLVSPERSFEARFVIWALGEIGADIALPALYDAVEHGFFVVDVCVAIGKIGQITSVGRLVPVLLRGLAEEREAAARGLAQILDRHRPLDAGSSVLEPLFERLTDLFQNLLNTADARVSPSTRFHLLLGLARMGRRIDPARLRRFLNVTLDGDELEGVAAFFASRRPRAPVRR